ncbi:MAG: methyltransferase domain-containing protein [Bryobacterales bacterium]|nr:methyltransferase domain-containing protein [Bryobacteraceae bacterium]MDW8130651.1 methyltransferase domain-containing protein [Bryobacterales bacterium]
MTALTAWTVILLAAGWLWQGGAPWRKTQQFRQQSLAPFVPSPHPVVEKMLEAARIKRGETVFDLGCGDGRVLITAARKYGARGVCIELSPDLVRQTREQIRRLGLEDRIEVIEGDLMNADLRSADVVTLYLLTSSNELLKPKLESSLRRGARVISHDFIVPGWEAERVEKVYASGRVHTIYVYSMPPRRR